MSINRNRLPGKINADLSLGCIASTEVSPPQNIASLKRCLCQLEEIDVINYATDTKLFFSFLNQSPLDDRLELSTLPNANLLAKPEFPLTFVVKSGLVRDKHRWTKSIQRDNGPC